jgi:thiamine-phosphate pyrophosphorylase
MFAVCRFSLTIWMRLESFHLNPHSYHVKRRVSKNLKNVPTYPPIDLSLYLVTERTYAKNDDEFVFKVGRAIHGGVTCIQIRDRREDLVRSVITACRLKKMMDRKGIPLIINDHLSVALAVNAEGVHIDQKEFSYQEVRDFVGPKTIIGWTVETWDDVYEAEQFPDIDYLGVQVFLSKHTKPHQKQVWGIEGLKKVRSISRHRVVAIGGIDLDNLQTVCSQLNLGPQQDGVAMVGALLKEKDPYPIAQKMRAIINAIV